jgi:hypothetical protein
LKALYCVNDITILYGFDKAIKEGACAGRMLCPIQGLALDISVNRAAAENSIYLTMETDCM